MKKLTLSVIVVLAPMTAMAEPLAPDIRAQIGQALTNVYHGYDSNNMCWPAKTSNGNGPITACVKLQVGGSLGSTDKYYIVVAGNNSKDSCHACQGLAGFFEFTKTNGRFTMTSKLSAVALGIYGDPGINKTSVSLLQLGASRTGLKVTSSNGGQGASAEIDTIYFPVGNKIIEAGSLVVSSSNEGAFEAGSPAIIKFKMTMQIDTSNPNLDSYPIIMHETGTDGRKPLSKTFTVIFDNRSGKYVTPADYPSSLY